MERRVPGAESGTGRRRFELRDFETGKSEGCEPKRIGNRVIGGHLIQNRKTKTF